MERAGMEVVLFAETELNGPASTCDWLTRIVSTAVADHSTLEQI